ncbi:MAG TPA: YsnF/AvaK domain-containing protein [Chloroflexota bacterium]|nr:YsnF/AvaK domain-containing protein [Chloroflexota bacterium]
MARTVVGYFRDRGAADAAYDDLVKNGFSRDEISIMGRGRDGGGGKGLGDDDHVGVGEGAAVGVVEGLLIGAAAMLIPGIGPVVAVGPLAAGLAGAITGGVTGVIVGGIVGALEDAGVDEASARYYDERFKQGGYLLTVRTDDMEYEKARMILERHDGDVRAGTGSMPAGQTSRGTNMATAGTTRTDWDTAMPGYRTRWQERFAGSGGRWEDYEPAYRFGYDMRNDPRFRGRSWAEVEPELRRDWESRYHDRPWDRFSSFIRDSWSDMTDSDRMQLKEERLQPEKESVKAGDVALRKDVVTEERSVNVPVRHEEVVVERRPVEARPATGDIKEGEVIHVPVREEQVHLEKQPVVTEEVSLRKQPVTETERVSGTVRREKARVDTNGDVDVRNAQDTSAGTRGTTPGTQHTHHFVNGVCACGQRER